MPHGGDGRWVSWSRAPLPKQGTAARKKMVTYHADGTKTVHGDMKPIRNWRKGDPAANKRLRGRDWDKKPFER